MNKTKIEWADYTWNPIKGICPEGCWYCYARKIYKRFKLDPTLRIDYAEINASFPQKPSRIFVCSTMELFHQDVDKLRIRDSIFKAIASASEHTFIILTKCPERIDRPMPENVWLGASITGATQQSIDRVVALCAARARVKFVSIEPFLDQHGTDVIFEFMAKPKRLHWIIVGRLTGHGSKHDPVPQQLGRLGQLAKAAGIPLFVKDNLVGIWPGELIREFPTSPGPT